jgi:hypothetical protein
MANTIAPSCWSRCSLNCSGAHDAGSEGGGRPSILAMDLASAAALGPIRSRNPQLDYWFGRSAAKVLEVFHQPLEAIISLRRYIARLIY